MKHGGSLESTKDAQELLSAMPQATPASWVPSKLPTCFIWRMNQLFYNNFNFFFSRDLFADVMSVHNRNMKHAHAIEFDQTNLLAML